jgi:carbon monoxide dehydrogenase subunit G
MGENQYQGILKIRVGPVQGTFNGDITLSDINAPESYSLVVNGRGAQGIVKGNGHLRLEAEGNTTIMHYEGDAQVSGRIAQVGQRLLDTSAKAVIRQSLEGLGQQIQARQTGAVNGTTSAPPVQAPTQTEFALGVAKNLIEDIIPPSGEQRDEFIQKGLFALASFLLLYILSEWWTNRIARKVARRLKKQLK